MAPPLVNCQRANGNKNGSSYKGSKAHGLFADTVDNDDAKQDVNAILPKKQKFKKEEGKENRGGRAVRIPV